MSLSVWQRNIVTESGDVIPDAEIEVFDAGSSSKPSLFSDPDGNSSITNPFNADSNGFARFYVSGGRYDIAVNGAVLWEDVALGTTQRRDTGPAPSEVPTNADILLTEDMTVRIPSDYATLQEALDETSRFRVKQGVTIDLLIESGHSPSSGITVEHGDYSHFRVASEDSTVNVANDYSGMFIEAVNARAPRLSCLVDADKKGSDGYHLRDRSTGVVDNHCGVLNAGSRGLYLNGNSDCYARRSDFSGAWNRGLWVTRNSTADVELGTFDNCNESQEVSTSNSVRRNSHVNASEASFSGGFNIGVNASRASTLNIAGGTISNNDGEGVRSERGSIVSMSGSGVATVNNNSGVGIRTFEFGIIEAGGCEIKDNGGGDINPNDGLIFARGATLTGDETARDWYDTIVSNTLGPFSPFGDNGTLRIGTEEADDGGSNVLIGDALSGDLGGFQRSAVIGQNSGGAISGASDVVFLGHETGRNFADGAENFVDGTDVIFIGRRAASTASNSRRCVAIGANAVVSSDSIALGRAALADESGMLAIGSSLTPVGFDGDDNPHSSAGSSAGYLEVKLNGTKYRIELHQVE